MRSFNANFITEKNKRSPDGPAPINLLTFNFATPVYLSDRDITPSGGSLHKGLVKAWGFIDSNIAATSGAGLLGSIEICDLQLTIINSESVPFSDNFTATDPPENVIVELYQWFSGLAYSEKELIFKGIIFSPPVYDLYECKLTIRGIWEKYNKLIGEDLIITQAAYPSADPDAIGTMLPICWGPVKNVPFRAVDAGALSALVEDITSSATTITLSNSSRFPSSGTVQIDNEKIAYTGNSSNQLTGCTRGYDSTTATAHTTGSYVIKIKSEYIYIIGCAVKAINTIYVDNIRHIGGYVAYTGQSGDEHASYPGKACIKFTALPVKLVKDIIDTLVVADNIAVTDNIAIADNIGVTDNINTTDNINVSDNINVTDDIAVSQNATSTHFSTDSDIGSTWHCDGGYVLDSKTISYAGANFSPTYDYTKSESGYSVVWNIGIEVLDKGTAGTLSVSILPFNQGSSVTIFDLIAGQVTIQRPGQFLEYSSAHYPTADGEIWVSASSSFDGDVNITLENVSIHFWEYRKACTKTGSAYHTGNASHTGNAYHTGGAYRTGNVSHAGGAYHTGGAYRNGAILLSGNSLADAIIGGLVTADLDGYQDDASGTYTGTANALIKRPDYVFKHIWNAILGASLSDINTSDFTASGSFFNTNSYEFSLVIKEPVQADELLMNLSLQCRSRFFVSLYGEAKLIVRQINQSSSHSIIKNEIKKDSVSIERSSRHDIINYFNIYYDLDHSKDKSPLNCQAVKNFQDSVSIDRYGRKEWRGDKNVLLFDAIILDAMAAHVGDFLLDYYAQIRCMPHLSFFLDNMETEPGDIIDITHDLDSMNGFVCEVIKILHSIGSAKNGTIDHLQITAIEN